MACRCGTGGAGGVSPKFMMRGKRIGMVKVGDVCKWPGESTVWQGMTTFPGRFGKFKGSLSIQHDATGRPTVWASFSLEIVLIRLSCCNCMQSACTELVSMLITRTN